MANEFNLLEEFDPPRARHTDPQTSHRAASRIRAGSRRAKILFAVASTGMKGAATFEVAKMLGVERDLVSSNFKPLVEMGFLEIGPCVRHNPKTNNGSLVYVVTDKYKNSPFARNTYPLNRPEHCRHCGGLL